MVCLCTLAVPAVIAAPSLLRAQGADSCAATCSLSVEDSANPGNCVPASTTPTPGTLPPLGHELLVASSGSVGVGTITPAHRIDAPDDMAARAWLWAGTYFRRKGRLIDERAVIEIPEAVR